MKDLQIAAYRLTHLFEVLAAVEDLAFEDAVAHEADGAEVVQGGEHVGHVHRVGELEV